MTNLFTLQARMRRPHGRGAARKSRREGHVPAVLYGRRGPTIPLLIERKQFGDISRLRDKVIALRIQDAGKDNVMLKDVQRDCVDDSLLHLDFIRVSLDDTTEVAVSITLKGEPHEGVVLKQNLRQVKLICPVTDIPSEIVVSVEALQIGDQIRASDLMLPEGLKLAEDPQTIILVGDVPAQEMEDPGAAPEKNGDQNTEDGPTPVSPGGE